MENWTAFPKKDLMMELFMAEQNLDDETLLFWNKIKINPEVWKCIDVIEDNFWIVAKFHNYVIWYNDIEEGFNISKFITEGDILTYTALKQELHISIDKLKNIH